MMGKCEVCGAPPDGRGIRVLNEQDEADRTAGWKP